MSCQKRKRQEPDPGNSLRIKVFFSQGPEEEQNASTVSQKNTEYQKTLWNIKNAQDQGCHLLKKIKKDQNMHQRKVINIILDVNHRKNQKKNMNHVLQQGEQDTLQDVLNTLEAVREEAKSQAGKEMLVCGMEGVEGFLNLAMPLSCLPTESIVKITFSNHVSEEENLVLGQQDMMSTDCVKFYIHAIEKTKKEIVKCKELHKEGNRLCVFGFKGETVKDAVCKDGRFLPLLDEEPWRLISSLDSVVESTQLVDELEGKVFQVAVESRRGASVAAPAKATATCTQNSELEKSRPRALKEYIVKEYPSLKREREKFRENFKQEMKTMRKSKATLIAQHRTNFRKHMNSFILATTIRFLSRALASVGYLQWDNNGKAGSATCFVFAQSFIFTCQHVIRDIVGPGVEQSQWAGIISRCAWVTFSYEDFETKDLDCFDIEPWFEITDVTLDYAVLKLKENGQEAPPGLYNGSAPPPPNGLVHIIGHPDGESKRTDRRVVVPQSARGEAWQGNYAGSVPEPVPAPSFVHMYSQNSFQEDLHNPDIVACDTSFYEGSAGSPVFDSNGSLVAMHTAGFTDEYQGRSVCLVEFGSAMRSILSHIEHNNKVWYEQVCAHQQDVEMMSQ